MASALASSKSGQVPRNVYSEMLPESFKGKLPAGSPKHAFNYDHVIAPILIGYIVFAFIYFRMGLFYLLPLYLFGIVNGAFCAVSLYYGFKTFSYYTVMRDTPIAKVEAAPEGFNQFVVRFVPTDNNTLDSPLSKTQCVFFSLSEHFMTQGKNQRDMIICSSSMTVPSMLSDGTGYLIVDYPNAEFSHIRKTFTPTQDVQVNTLNVPFNQAAMFQQAQTAQSQGQGLDATWRNAQQANLAFMLKDMTFRDISKGGSFARAYGVKEGPLEMGGGFIYFAEDIFPTDTDFFVGGGVTNLDTQFMGKPVKYLSVEKMGRELFILPEEKDTWVKKYRKTPSILFGFGIIFVILTVVGIGLYLSPGIFSAYLNTSAGSTAFPTTTASGSSSPPSVYNYTTAPSSPQNPSVMSTSGTSCGNFTVATSGMAITTQSTCSWSSGYVNIYYGSGDSGWIEYSIVGNDGTTYASSSSTNWCSTFAKQVYLPAQSYTVTVHTGQGGGSCGFAFVQLSSTS
jgi:hypothetical protein